MRIPFESAAVGTDTPWQQLPELMLPAYARPGPWSESSWPWSSASED